MIKNLTQSHRFVHTLLSSRTKPLQIKNLFAINTQTLHNQSKLIHCNAYDFATYDKKSSRPQQSSNKKSHQTNEPRQERKPLKIRPSRKQQKQQEKESKKSFTLSITDPQLFIQHINQKNTIQDAVKLMNRILNDKSLTKHEFQENVWKKYSYYVYLIGEQEQKDWGGKSNEGKDEEIKTDSENKKNEFGQGNNKSIFEEGQTTNQQSKLFNSNPSSQKQRPDNHQLSRQNKRKKLCIQFLSQITQLQERFKGELTSQNITKTFNKFIDHFFQREEWSSIGLAERLSLLESLSRYNIKKAKTLFLKRRDYLFDKPKTSFTSNENQLDRKQIQYQSEDVVKILSLMTKLEINDTALFEKCIDLVYEHVDQMKLDKLEEVTFLLGKSHKFVNKDLLIKLKNRFNQLINQFNDTEIIQSLHIISSFSMIEKNMQLKSIYFEPLDIIYERIIPIFDMKLLSRLKSKFLVSLASSMRRSQYFDEAVLNALVEDSMKRQVLQFIQSDKDSFANLSPANRLNNQFGNNNRSSTITIPHLTQIFFALANFNYRQAQFMDYYINLLTVIQQSNDPEKYISYPLFSRLLWSICVLCNDNEVQKLLPLMQYFYKKSKVVEPHQATNFYYCYLLMKRKYLVSEIRFENDKVQQYILGPKHQIQISQTQKEIHKGLLNLGIPSLIEYNLNNVICDIYIPKYQDIEHLIIEVHGFHHFCRNLKRSNGATVLKEKIIENEGYECYYISLDEWLIAEDKEQFLKDFFETIVIKKHTEKKKKKLLEESLKTVQKIEKKGRRVLEFKRGNRARQNSENVIEQNTEETKRLTNNEDPSNKVKN